VNILFLTQVLPYPLDAGPKTRAYYVLRSLADAGHSLTLVSFVRESDRPEYISHLSRYCAALHTVRLDRSMTRDGWSFLKSAAGMQPFLIVRDWVPRMARCVRKTLKEDGPFDAVHADQLWMASYALMARNLARTKPLRVVLDQHNAVFQIPRRMAQVARNPAVRLALRLEASKLERYEQRTIKTVDRVTWVTEEDRTALYGSDLREGHHDGGRVIPIAVDPELYRPIARSTRPHRVTFLGGLHWPPNAEGIEWFRREAWPLISAEVPKAVLTVIGRNPRSGPVIKEDASVEVTGYIEDPTPLLADTAAFVIPLRAGGGMRVKLLEAWCWKVPVVSTSIGAEGTRALDGVNVLIADTPRDFAAAVVRLLRDRDFEERVAGEGRRTVEEHYDWRKTYSAWNEVYQFG